MTEHTEKKQIFDTYAKEQGCMSFENLLAWHKVGDKTMIEHIFAACDLVQKEQQKRIAENQRKIFYKFYEEGKGNSPEMIVQANSNENAYKEAYSHLGPMTEDLFYEQLTDEETLMMKSNLIK